MSEFIILLGRLMIIALAQMVISTFLEGEKLTFHIKVLNIVCIFFCLYLLLDFVFNYIWGEIAVFIPMEYFN